MPRASSPGARASLVCRVQRTSTRRNRWSAISTLRESFSPIMDTAEYSTRSSARVGPERVMPIWGMSHVRETAAVPRKTIRASHVGTPVICPARAALSAGQHVSLVSRVIPARRTSLDGTAELFRAFHIRAIALNRADVMPPPIAQDAPNDPSVTPHHPPAGACQRGMRLRRLKIRLRCTMETSTIGRSLSPVSRTTREPHMSESEIKQAPRGNDSTGPLKLADVRRVFRLVGEIRELGADPNQWRPYMTKR